MNRHLLIRVAVLVAVSGGSLRASAQLDDIIVSTDEELEAAMVPANAYRTIVILSRYGDPEQDHYIVRTPLLVPEGATVLGEGVMRYDGRLPIGFEPWSVTRLTPSSDFCPVAPAASCLPSGSPELLTLADGASVSGLTLDGRAAGNALSTVGVSSSSSGPVFVSVSECEIIGPGVPQFGPWGGDGFLPQGAVGRGVFVRTRHADSSITVQIERSIVDGNGVSGLFLNNLASGGQITLFLTESVLGGTGNQLEAIGGASGPETRDETTGAFLYEVVGARTVVHSHGNRYGRQGAGGTGIVLQGGFDGRGYFAPPGQTRPGGSFNQVELYSVDDRIDGVALGVAADGAFTSRDDAEPSSYNEVIVHLVGTTLNASVQDLRLCATRAGFLPPFVLPLTHPAGDGNTIRVLARRVEGGNAAQPNTYSLACGSQPLGDDNAVQFIGNRVAFEHTNVGLYPTPDAGSFIGNGPQ